MPHAYIYSHLVMLVYKQILYITRLLFCQGYPESPFMCSFSRQKGIMLQKTWCCISFTFALKSSRELLLLSFVKRLAGRCFTFIILVASCFHLHNDEDISRCFVEAMLMIERVISLLESGNRGLKWIMFESYENLSSWGLSIWGYLQKGFKGRTFTQQKDSTAMCLILWCLHFQDSVPLYTCWPGLFFFE